MDQNRANESRTAEHRKSYIGIVMTIIYAVIYGGFVFLSVFYPSLMGIRTFFGMNLAITYGLSLIVIAIVLAMIYNQMVRTRTSSKKPKSTPKTDRNEMEN
ncbi:MAG: DUF485 domain-containing protein [Brevefilum sp.]